MASSEAAASDSGENKAEATSEDAFNEFYTEVCNCLSTYLLTACQFRDNLVKVTKNCNVTSFRDFSIFPIFLYSISSHAHSGRKRCFISSFYHGLLL